MGDSVDADVDTNRGPATWASVRHVMRPLPVDLGPENVAHPGLLGLWVVTRLCMLLNAARPRGLAGVGRWETKGQLPRRCVRATWVVLWSLGYVISRESFQYKRQEAGLWL